MCAKTVTGYVRQVLDDCDIDKHARELLQELYSEALKEMNKEEN